MPTRLEHLTAEEKRELLTQTLKKKVAEPVVAPLSLHQKRLWFLDQLEPGNTLYNIAGAARIKGPLHLAIVEHVINEIVRRHESLRTTFRLNGLDPVQIISPPHPLSINSVDLRESPRHLHRDEISRLIQEETRKPFSLATGPLTRITLMRLADDEHIALLVLHHIIADGWSIGVFLWELASLYEAELQGKPSSLPELAIQYRDYVHWQQQKLQGTFLDELISFWKKELDGAPQGIQFPTDRPRSPSLQVEGTRASFVMSPTQFDALTALSKREGTTLFMTLLAAFATLLNRSTGQEDILIGCPFADRERPETHGLIGFLVNTIVLRLDLSGNPTFAELLKRVQSTALAVYAHQDLPFDKLVEVMQPERNFGTDPLLHVLFTLQNMPMPEFHLTTLRVSRMDIETGNAPFDLGVECSEWPEGMRVTIAYNAHLFNSETIERLLSQYQFILQAATAHPDQHIAEISLLSDSDRSLILFDWNATDAPIPEDACVHHLFESQVKRNRTAPAVCSDTEMFTYEQLDVLSTQLAQLLIGQGVGPETAVGLCVERSLDTIIALLGILKAGGAYVPIDPIFPAERIAYILQNAGVRLVVTQDHLAEQLRVLGTETLSLDSERALLKRPPATNIRVPLSGRNLAYILYTSGSTGEPKGVMVEHRSVVNLITSFQQTYAPGVSDRVLQLSSISFDASVAEIFPILCSGGRLVIPPTSSHLDVDGIVSSIQKHEVTIIGAVPSVLATLNARHHEIPSVRLILSGGETLSDNTIDKLLHSATVTNGYGPTETTVCSLYYKIANHDASLPERLSRIPIGRPIINTQVFILDASMNPVPIGIAGDLYIAGAGLARGYVNDQPKTATQFLPNPFARKPGERLYRTGDIARYRADGCVEFLGRADQQVKIRGVRIELHEIENALRLHSAVRDVAAIVKDVGANDRRLLAYYSLHNGTGTTVLELRKHMLDRLPAYMVPSHFIHIPSFPLTPSGKVDYAKLPATSTAIPDASHNYVPPRNEREVALVRLWTASLNVERIGVNDDFFALGGHSLLAVQLMNLIRNELHLDVPLRYLFESPTVAQLAERIDVLQEHGGEPQGFEADDSSSLVPMRTNDNALTVYCIHHIGGDISSYNHLAEALASRCCVFGLRSRALLDPSREHQSLEEMARRYAELIVSQQHRGPFVLIGYSSGGLLAMAVTRAIELMGHNVGLVALIDTGLPNYDRRHLEHDEIANLLRAIRDTFSAEFEAIESHWGELMDEASGLYKQLLPLTNEARVELVCTWFEGLGLPQEQTRTILKQRLTLYQHHLLMLKKYALQTVRAPLLVFRATDGVPGAPLQEQIDWKQHTTGEVNAEDIEGNHFTIVKPPAVTSLAARLMKSFDTWSDVQ